MTAGVGTDPGDLVIDAEGSQRFAESLGSKDNSLNFLRVAFATAVVLSHAAGIATFAVWRGIVNGTTVAQIALYGFFAISGYLITQSMFRSTVSKYLSRRVLRIFPGLIICLVVTAFGIALVDWLIQGDTQCGLHCYFGASDGPFTYVLKNALLANPFWTQHTIAGLPHTVFANWNASIWTLFYEFCCYLLIVLLFVVGILRHRLLVLAGLVLLWVSILACTVTPALHPYFSVFRDNWIEAMMRFAEIFLTGSVLYLFRDRVPDSGWLALACAGLVVLGVVLPTSGYIPTYDFTPLDIFLPAIVYPVLWIGVHLPFRRVGAVNDYSYGIYIYGWPISILMLTAGAADHGPVLYLLICLAATTPLAIASWWLVERHALAYRPKWAYSRKAGPEPAPIGPG